LQYSFNTAVANNGLCEPYLLQTAHFCCVCLSNRGCLIWVSQICQNSKAKAWKPALFFYHHQPVLCSLLKHAVSANQSARYMETLL